MSVPEDIIGKAIGHITIQRKLGQGGMGAVYLANHSGLHRSVAVKFLEPELAANPEFIGRFQREARLAARLEHPNVVQVHDVGQVDGLHYIIMQFVEGKSLDLILKEKKRITVGEALSITKRVAVALAAAAKLGIVHRDIKPHNILISKEGVVKVADFGLAKDNDSNRTISEAGQIVGTPYYMSPEQAQGREVDPRGDIYSLGATLYHMLTGQRVFEGGTPIAIVMKQINEAPRPAVQLEPALPEGVQSLLDRMMKKDPAQRFQTAEELIRELDAVKAGAAPREGVLQRLSRRRLILPVAGILLIGIVLGLMLGGKKAPKVAPAPVAVAVKAPPAPVPKAPEPPPKPAAKPDSRDAVLSRLRDAAEKRWGEEILQRCDEFLKAAQKKDGKALKAMMDTLTFGESSEQAYQELLSKLLGEKVSLEGWEFQDLDVKVRALGRLQPHAQVMVTYHLKVPNGELKIQNQGITWVKRLDGAWYVTRPPRQTGK